MIKRHPWRFAFALLAAIILVRAVTIAFPRTMPGESRIESRTEALLQSYRERNQWIVSYYDRTGTGTAKENYVRGEIRQADALGDSILKNVRESGKHAELKRDIAQYMKHQCNIAQHFGKPPNAQHLWVRASYSQTSYNKTVEEETSIFRSMFGGKTTAPDCPRK
jgi:hypothetical protein